jgi:hypothetical protein
MFSAEEILLPLQRLQLAHDEAAHRDILSFSLHTRLKHMVLHFYKYAGNIEAARVTGDRVALRRTLVDAYIICMASANALNLSLGEALPVYAEARDLDSLAQVFGRKLIGRDVFSEAISQFVLIGGKMAKALESEDHMEDGNPRAAMMMLVPRMTEAVLGLLGHLDGGLDTAVRKRLQSVEQKSIFSRLAK